MSLVLAPTDEEIVGRLELLFADEAPAQVVTVNHRWAYRWEKAPALEVGERVRLPESWVQPGTWVGTVTALGSDYTGPMRAVLARVVLT